MTFPIFDPLPVPPFEIPETARRARERAEAAAARELAADPSSTDTIRGSTPNRTRTQEQVPVPARLQAAVPASEKDPDPEPAQPVR